MTSIDATEIRLAGPEDDARLSRFIQSFVSRNGFPFVMVSQEVDMAGGYNPLKDAYKMTVFAISAWRNKHKPKIGLTRDQVGRIASDALRETREVLLGSDSATIVFHNYAGDLTAWSGAGGQRTAASAAARHGAAGRGARSVEGAVRCRPRGSRRGHRRGADAHDRGCGATTGG